MRYEYYPVIDVLRTNISVALGEFIKAHLKQNDYESITHIAKIGNEAESFLDSLYERFVEDVDDAQIIDVTPVAPAVQETKVAKSSVRREQEPKDKYNHMKVFIFKYIGGRGGRTRISDLANAFHNEFKHLFTETDYEIVSGSCTKWQHKMYDQVKTMRSQGMINPKTKGKDYRNYSLTVAGMKHYKKYASRLEKQLELPDMFEEG